MDRNSVACVAGKTSINSAVSLGKEEDINGDRKET